MDWMSPALIATISSSLVLALVYVYIYTADRERFMGIWAVAWAIYSLRFGFMYGVVLGLVPGIFLGLNQLISLIHGILLLWGVYVYISGKLPRWLLVLATADAIWIMTTVKAGMQMVYISLPTFIFLALVNIWIGMLFLKRGKGSSTSGKVVGWTFIIWGLHKADYPFLRPVEWFAPWGYLLGSLLAIIAAVSIILVYYEENRTRLARSEGRFRRVLDSAGDAIFVIDNSKSRIINVNEYACRTLGYTREELLALAPADIEVKYQRENSDHLVERLKAGTPVTVDGMHRRKDGSIFPVEVRIARLEGDTEPYVLAIARDVTERKRAEEALRWTQFSVDNAADAIFWMKKDATIAYANKAACQSLGYSKEELLSLSVPDVDSMYDEEKWIPHWDKLKKRGFLHFESFHRRKDGSAFPVEIMANHMEFEGREYNCAFVRDITERKEMEESINTSLREKEVLLKEIHHRVKNNLQIISALSSMQARHVQDPDAQSQFMETKNRIRAMAMVHEMLYRSENLSSVNLPEYINSLLEHLYTSFSTSGVFIRPELDIEDISLDTDILITLGLLLTELITNSLRHAFPEGKGTLWLSFHTGDDGNGVLIVRDDGTGLPEGIDIMNSETLGFQLVTILAGQLQAKVSATCPEGGGTEFVVEEIHLAG